MATVLIDDQTAYELSEAQLAALAVLEDAAAARLRATLQESFRAISARIDSNWADLQAKGGLALQIEVRKLDQIRASLEILSPEIANRVRDEFEGIFREGGKAGDTLAQALIQSRQSNTVRTFAEMPVVAITNIAAQSMERLSGHALVFREKATQLLLLGLTQGWGPQKVKQALQQQLNVVAHRAETIQRTETLSALNAASNERYRREGVALVEFVPTGDDRTCPTCADRAGEIYKIDEAPSPPIHPRCRCVLVPADDRSLADREWSREFREEVRALAGGETDPSPAAFETVRPVAVEVP